MAQRERRRIKPIIVRDVSFSEMNINLGESRPLGAGYVQKRAKGILTIYSKQGLDKNRKVWDKDAVYKAYEARPLRRATVAQTAP